MVVVSVVQTMRDLPTVKGDQEHRVCNMATELVVVIRIRERIVTTVVSDDKQTPIEKPGDIYPDKVSYPGRFSKEDSLLQKVQGR